MKNNKTKIEEYSGMLILILSILSFLIGFIMALFLVIKNIFYKYVISDSEVRLIMILVAGGLLGSVLDFVLKRHIEEYLKKYLDKEKINSILEVFVEDIIEKNIQLKQAEELKAEKEETTPHAEINTVIVPVALSFNAVMNDNVYKCPIRTFKPNLEYIAFYKDKKIIGYGQLSPNNPIIDNDEMKFNFIEFKSLQIPHESKGAYVQNKVYCTFSNLISAKNTSEISQ